ncbi:MAG: PEGA domain-containing protein, partial [Verrucomicrobiae bacterium]|nr:PEGA domain-containing protein [Verrucomicrobiae bacterium]
HRDIKPANLILTETNQLKVTDFGIARNITDSVSRLSMRGNDSSGTPGYMSPQQAMGDRAAVADDVYSIGATLYDLLTSRPPFYSGDIPLQILNKVPPSIEDRRVELGIVSRQPVPDDWEEVIAACLEKSPRARPASVSEIKDRLGAPPVFDELESIALTQSPIINRGGPIFDEPPPTRITTRRSTAPSSPSSRRSQHGSDRADPISVPSPSRLGAAVPEEQAPMEKAPAAVPAPEPVERRSTVKQLMLLLVVGLIGAFGIGAFAAHYMSVQEAATREKSGTVGPIPPVSVAPAVSAPDPAETTRLEQLEEEKNALLATVAELRRQAGEVEEAGSARDQTLEELRDEMAELRKRFAKKEQPALPTTPVPPLPVEPQPSTEVKAPLLAQAPIKLTPEGATLMINNEALENPGETIELPPGEHLVRVTYKDWQPLERSIVLKAGENPALDLSLAHATIILNSSPPGAALSVDGKAIGSAPCEILGEAGRTYQIAARLGEWEAFETSISAPRQGRTEKTIHIPYGTVKFSSEPRGATVSVGGRTMETPCTMLVEANKDLTAVFRYQNWSPFERSVRIGDAKKLDVFCRIPHGKIWVTSTPSGVGAVVYSDSEKLGYIGKDGSEFVVAAGKRTIEISGDSKFSKIRQQVTVTDGETSRLDEIAFTGVQFLSNSVKAIEVWIDGKLAGRTPFFWELERSSALELRFVKAGYKTGADHLVISRGRVLDYDVKLEPEASVRAPEVIRKAEPLPVAPQSPAPEEPTSPVPEPSSSPQLGEHFTSATGLAMRWIPTVRGGFWASAHEITRSQYQSLMGADPSTFVSSPNLPVQNVTYQQAVQFCGTLLAKERDAGRAPAGYTYHLPSVSEWRQMLGRHSANLAINSYVVWKRSQATGPATVGSLSANQFGLHDIRGNMMEWCRDKSSKGYNVLAGGSWSTEVKSATNDTTQKTPDYSENNTGFRVVLVKAAP